MSAAAPLARPAILEDLLALPEEDRYELIDGELLRKETAKARHGVAQTSLSALLFPYRRRGGPPGHPAGWWFASEVDVYFDERNTLLPDVAGWRWERLPEVPNERPIRVVPDWTCEILSTNKRRDLITKKRVYHRSHVPHYWIIDPVEEMLTVYRWAPEGFLEVLVAQRGEKVRAEPFDLVELQVSVLFGDDPED
jgi:Uma2 family endonuclease